MWMLSFSSSKHPPTWLGSPTSGSEPPKLEKHSGGSFWAATLLVATVTSPESELPSLPLNLKRSEPVCDAVYWTDANGESWPVTCAAPLGGASVIAMGMLSLSSSEQFPAGEASPTSKSSGPPPRPSGGSFWAATLLVVTVVSVESELPSLPLNLNESEPTCDAVYRTVGF